MSGKPEDLDICRVGFKMKYWRDFVDSVEKNVLEELKKSWIIIEYWGRIAKKKARELEKVEQ